MRWAAAGLAALWAAALIAAGVPLIGASIAKAPAAAVLPSRERPTVFSTARLRRAERGLGRSLAWRADGTTLQELGTVELLIAESPGVGGDEREQLTEQAIGHLEDGLRRVPGRPHSWLRLAYAASQAGRGPAAVGDYLLRSVVTGRHVPELTFLRLDLLLENWAGLGHDGRIATTGQIRIAWQQDPQRLARLAVAAKAIPVVTLALVRDPDAQRELDAMLRQLAAP